MIATLSSAPQREGKEFYRVYPRGGCACPRRQHNDGMLAAGHVVSEEKQKYTKAILI
jgi:hypothetical protein